MKNGRNRSLVLLAGLVLGACRAAPGQEPLDRDIVASDIRARISFLASDLLLGRRTPSRPTASGAGPSAVRLPTAR